MNVKKLTLNNTTLTGVKLLSLLDQPIRQLHTHGDIDLLNRPILTVVGSRRPTPYGLNQTTSIIRGLRSSNAVICSGLALGVDSQAHKASLDNNLPTIAVLASGIDNIYPSLNNGLARQILDRGGLIISESAGDYRPYKHDFIKRNRIIAALADALYIPEAANKSGSLHTANFALDLGIDIFASPGRVGDPLSEGTNNLLATGANIAWDSSTIAESLPGYAISRSDPLEQLLETEAYNIDQLAGLLKTSVAAVGSQLSLLEISGHAQRQNGLWTLKK